MRHSLQLAGINNFVIGWSRYRLGLPRAPLHYMPTWPVGIPIVFQNPVRVPLHSPNSLPIGLCARGLCNSLELSVWQLCGHWRHERWSSWQSQPPVMTTLGFQCLVKYAQDSVVHCFVVGLVRVRQALMPAWIFNHMFSKVWGGITYPFPSSMVLPLTFGDV